MLISKGMNSIFRILLSNWYENKPNLKISDLAEKATMTRAMIKRILLRLEKSEYVTIRKGAMLNDPIKMIKAWGYAYSIRELENRQFIAADRPQNIMLKIMNKARSINLRYAFTLFSATEQVNPYVVPSSTHLYILEKDFMEWNNVFKEFDILPTEKDGNVICFLVGEDYFEGVKESRGVMITSLPQLYADLFSYGGRGEEAAEKILEVIKRRL